MRILSLFDGMSCGFLAMLGCGIDVERYVAYEADKYAVQTSSHNFPIIEHMGDVFNGDFSAYEGFDFLVGGSPCTYWSIAKTSGRETEASGLGWELFSQYVRALKEAKPKYFIYENNKSMSDAIRESITETFGFKPICINSSLVSAQNRQRLYWVGIRQDDGTYKRAFVRQPKDRGIVLKDILETNAIPYQEKVHVLTAHYDGACIWNSLERSQRSMVAEPVGVTSDGKSHTIKAQYYKNSATNFLRNGFDATGVSEPVRVGELPSADGELKNVQALRVYSPDGKLVTLNANGGGQGAKTGLYAERIPSYGQDDKSRPVEATYSKHSGTGEGSLESRLFSDNKAKQQVDLIAEAIPINTLNNEGEKARTIMSGYAKYGDTTILSDKGFTGGTTAIAEPLKVSEATKKGYVEIAPGDCVDMKAENSKTRKGRSMTDKSNCLDATNKFYQYLGNVNIYKVEDGQIEVKGKKYPIRLIDGYYIIRKLSVTECMRLQTVPEWYEFPVSNSQAYKMLGNGWTIEVIKHLIQSALDDDGSHHEEIDDEDQLEGQTNIFDFI